MSRTDRDQIVEICGTAVSPPDDVVKSAMLVADTAAGDRTAFILSVRNFYRPRSARRCARFANRVVRPRFSSHRRVQHHTVSHISTTAVMSASPARSASTRAGISTGIGQSAIGRPPVAGSVSASMTTTNSARPVRATPAVPRSTPSARARQGIVVSRTDHRGSRRVLFGRTSPRSSLGVPRRGVPRSTRSTVHRRFHHAVGVDPRGHSNVAALTFETIEDAVIGLDALDLQGDSTGELLRCRHFSHRNQSIGLREQLVACRRQQRRPTRVTTSMCAPVVAPSPNAPANLGAAASVLERCVAFTAAPSDVFDAFSRPEPRRSRWRYNFATNMPFGGRPCLHLTYRHQTRLDQIIARRSIVEHRNNAMHTLDNSNRIHTTNRVRGCHTVSR